MNEAARPGEADGNLPVGFCVRHLETGNADISQDTMNMKNKPLTVRSERERFAVPVADPEQFFPQLFRMGGITQALFVDGGNCTMGIFLICCGASLNIRQMGLPLYKGVVLTAIKFFVGVGIGVFIGTVFGPAGILGITPMVAIAALTNSNSSLYIILSSRYGDASDAGAVSILSLNDGPFFTLVALGATGFASIDLSSMFSVLFPLAIGILWGSYDSQFREICKGAQA